MSIKCECLTKLKGTKTEKNLMEAFAGESKAHTQYLYFASKAKKEGYNQIANYFTETALNEKEHAKIWFQLLNCGEVPSTIENLKTAASGEHYEWTSMYKQMAADAREEGFNRIADLFEAVSQIESTHEKRYLDLLKNIEENKVFSRDTDEEWVCMNCGNIVKGKEAPNMCPVCSHEKSYYKLLKKDY